MSELKKERTYGIDVVRLVSMFMVVLVHLFGVGGVVSTTANPALKAVFCLLQGISLCCINLFAMASGFIHYGRRPHLSGLMQLWLQSFFWITVTFFAFAAFKGDLSVFKENFSRCILLVSKREYWYLTDYVILFFFIPFLNAAVNKIDLKYLTFALLLLLTVTSFIPSGLPYIDPVSMGYSFTWLAIMYLVGAYIKKYDVINKIKPAYCAMIFGVFAVLEGLYSFLSYSLGYDLKDYYYKFSAYNCILVVAASIMLFLLMARIKVKSDTAKKLLKTASAASFAVYLIHCSPLIFDNYIDGKMKFITAHGIVGTVGMLFAVAGGIYVVGISLGVLQNELFRIIRTPKLFKFIENKINLCYDSIYKKLTNT